MTISDILLAAALAAFVLVWWLRRLPARPVLLLAAALVALAAAAWGVLDDRWQDAAGAMVALAFLAVLLVNRLRKAPARSGPPIVSGALLAVLAAGAVALPLLFPVAPLPEPSGPAPVGVRSFEVADPSRPGLLAAAPGEPRRLLVRVWYPAGDVSGHRRRPYFTQAEADTTGRSMGRLFGFPPFVTYLKHVRTNSYENAPLKPGARDLPVLIYSHGYTSFLGQNTALMEHLASHGYVVFSLQHTYDSSATVFPNGDVAGDDPKLLEENARATTDDAAGRARDAAQRQALAGKTAGDRLEGYLRLRELSLAGGSRLLASGRIWADDRIFLHDQLQAGALPPEIRQITAASRLDRVGEMGMSFGGATTGTVCLVDRRCAAGINLDGGDFPFQAVNADMPVPFLMFHAEQRLLAEQLGAEARGPKRSFNEFSYESFGRTSPSNVLRTELRGARHLGLSDFSLFMRRPVRDVVIGSAPAKVMIESQNDFVRGFFDHYLLGRQNGFPKNQLDAYRSWITPIGNEDIHRWWAGVSPEQRAATESRIARLKAAGP